MRTNGIPYGNIKPFLQNLQDNYEGITETIRNKMEVILFTKTWDYEVLEWQFNKGGTSIAKYFMIAFGKSQDGSIDCVYSIYTLEFELNPKVVVTQKKHSVLFGLISWTTEETQTEERSLGPEAEDHFKNFFRVKTLEGLRSKGIID
ncbi:uncharacterized protein LOC134281118 [Saccostrea cucullata]|uniref:uncharacterized protein LOC134281118 n=1 Tax=Saccostrea cuccullata TaxID=36930 RepID=UPI002ED0A9B0